MSDIIGPGAGILFMKVGTHARESLQEIIARKREEIAREGFGMWGYGGNSCHPRTMVQSFAKSFAEKDLPIYLCMEEMKSKHFAEPLRASQSSVDGIKWETIPSGINVLGSRFALVIETLDEPTPIEQIPLERTRVALGPSKGRLGSKYIRGHVDKACLEILRSEEVLDEDLAENDRKTVTINLVAKLMEPYAVLLK